MVFVYGILSFPILVAALPFALIAAVFSERYRKGFSQRLGWSPRLGPGNRVLIQLASVGEVISGEKLVKSMAEKIGADRVVVSVMTPTGHAEAVRRFPGIQTVFFPADAGPIPAVWLSRLGIRRVILFETELWPMFLLTCRARGIPVGVVNARISDRSFPRYRAVSLIVRPLLSRIAFFGAQTEEYRTRLTALGARPEVVSVTGNLKFEIGIAKPAAGDFADLLTEFSQSRRAMIFASTHEGEEEAALSCFSRISKAHPDAAMIIAPRHKERFSAVRTLVRSRFPEAIVRSEWKPGDGIASNVLLLDTLGELSSCFAFGYAAFLGGSIAPVGGHNVLEPAASGLPVAVGLHTQNFRAEVELLKSRGGLVQAGNAEELIAVFGRWLADPDETHRAGEAARRAVEENRGVLAATLDLLASNAFLE